MTARGRLGAFLAAGLLSLAPLVSAAEVTEEQVRRWIADLASDEFAAREEATERLKKAGPVARGPLEEAADSKDPEVRFRARMALRHVERAAPSAGAGEETGIGVHATAVSIEQGPDRIRVTVTEQRDGKSEKKVYEAPDRAAFKEKHPEVFERYLGTGDDVGIRFLLREPGVMDFEGELQDLEREMRRLQERFMEKGLPEAPDDPPAASRLGVLLEPVPEALAAHLGTDRGALVAWVEPGSPAGKAGLERWDILTAVGESRIDSPGTVRDALRGVKGPLRVAFLREGKPREVQVSLDAAGGGE